MLDNEILKGCIYVIVSVGNYGISVVFGVCMFGV